MRIVVIADSLQEEACRLKATHAGIAITFVHTVEEAVSHDAAALIDLMFERNAARISLLRQFQRGPVFINAVEETIHETDPSFTRLNAWPGFLQRALLEVSGEVPAAFEILNTIGWNYKVVADIPGMISARVISMIVNEAYFAKGENVSSEKEIDTAMKLGTNYPYGPFEWAAQIGLQKIYSLLLKLSAENKRYEPAPALIAAVENIQAKA